MDKTTFKQFHSDFRKIRKAKIVGEHGHMSDLVNKYNITMEFIRSLEPSRKLNKFIVGQYTRNFQEKSVNKEYWESYGERKMNA